MMLRRQVLGGLAALLPARIATAQVSGRVYRIGYLGYTAVNTPQDERVLGAFFQRLRELGYVEGRNFVVEWRFAEGRNERYADFAAEMVQLKVNVVVVASGTAARAVMAASRTLPIVATALPDPVRAGLVASLARPGGQLTGISNLSDELVPKRLELLKAAVPAARVIAFANCPRCRLSSGTSAANEAQTELEQQAAARSLGVRLLPLDVNAASDFDSAAALLRRERPDALLIGASQINVALKSQWLTLATELALPMLAPYRGFDAMLSYGPEYRAIYRKVAEYVAKVLAGANPGEMAMEQPTIFELVVDLKQARALGITIPQSLLVRADEVIR